MFGTSDWYRVSFLVASTCPAISFCRSILFGVIQFRSLPAKKGIH